MLKKLCEAIGIIIMAYVGCVFAFMLMGVFLTYTFFIIADDNLYIFLIGGLVVMVVIAIVNLLFLCKEENA